jgi:hypothetical protein
VPAVFVIAVVAPPAKVALAPLAGAVNCKVTPPTPWPSTPVTNAESGPGKAVSMGVLCGVPLLTAMDAGGANHLPTIGTSPATPPNANAIKGRFVAPFKKGSR